MLRDEPALELAECANAIYDPACERVIGTASNARVTVYDAQTGQLLTTLQEAHQSDSSLPARAQRHRRACVSPDNSMVMSDGMACVMHLSISQSVYRTAAPACPRTSRWSCATAYRIYLFIHIHLCMCACVCVCIYICMYIDR